MYKLDKIPSKVESFIKKLDKQTQSRLSDAFDYILESPFKHNNPTVIKEASWENGWILSLSIGKYPFCLSS